MNGESISRCFLSHGWRLVTVSDLWYDSTPAPVVLLLMMTNVLQRKVDAREW